MKSYEKLNVAINKLKSKVSVSESKSKSLLKKITEAAEYVDPDVKSQIDDIIGTLKDENFYNKDSRRKFVNHLHNLITLENESPEARQSVKKFVKYVSDAITEYEIDIADDSDMVDSENIVAEEIKNKERMKNMRMKSESKIDYNLKLESKNQTSKQKLEHALSKVKSYLPEAIHLDKSDITYVDRQLSKVLSTENLADVRIKFINAKAGYTHNLPILPEMLINLIVFYSKYVDRLSDYPLYIMKFIKNKRQYVHEDKQFYETQFEKLLPIIEGEPVSVKIGKFWFNLNWEFVISLCKFYEENFAVFTESRNLKEAELWSGDVKTKEHPPEGLFSSGSAKDIASWAKRSHDDLQSAMSSLNFYLNRAGENISSEAKNRIENAKEILRGLY